VHLLHLLLQLRDLHLEIVLLPLQGVGFLHGAVQFEAQLLRLLSGLVPLVADLRKVRSEKFCYWRLKQIEHLK